MNLFKLKSFLKIYLAILISTVFISCSSEDKKTGQGTAQASEKQTYEIIKDTGNWPQFRGNHAAGVVDEQNLPDTWNGKTGENIKWKTLIPGLAHSSPIIWENKLFVTTAISSKKGVSFKHGLYGDGDASEDKSVHKWNLYCLNKKSGKILWELTMTEGVPIDKRHIKSTYASSTPVTDGKYVVAFFGSQGLFASDMDGKLLWKKDLGRLNIGAYDKPEYEWGGASSPIIYKDKVIVQCDTQNESFLIACDIKTGETVWKTMRDELPSWGTPTIVNGSKRVELVTNSSNWIYGYNPESGKEFWRLGGSSQITTPTPIFHKDFILVCSGRRPEAPIFAIKAGADGDISLKEGETSNEFVAWYKLRRGPYMPTPLIYRGYFYTLHNSGRFECFELETGKDIYRERTKHSGGGFSASPVAADGKIYLPGEDGDIFIIKAGPEFENLAMNNMGERLMATPTISDGMMYVRAEKHLFAVGQ